MNPSHYPLFFHTLDALEMTCNIDNFSQVFREIAHIAPKKLTIAIPDPLNPALSLVCELATSIGSESITFITNTLIVDVDL